MYTQEQADKIVLLHQQFENEEFIKALQKEFPSMNVETADLLNKVIIKTLDEIVKTIEMMNKGIIS